MLLHTPCRLREMSQQAQQLQDSGSSAQATSATVQSQLAAALSDKEVQQHKLAQLEAQLDDLAVKSKVRHACMMHACMMQQLRT
jgi:hypothetical protein